MSKEASEQLVQVVESLSYRLKDRGVWIPPGNGLAQVCLCCSLVFQVPRELPRDGATQHDPVAPEQAPGRRHCTTSSCTASAGLKPQIPHSQSDSSAASGAKPIFVWAVSETASSTGAELAPFVTEPVHSQAEQVHHWCGCSWRQVKAHKLNSTVYYQSAQMLPGDWMQFFVPLAFYYFSH